MSIRQAFSVICAAILFSSAVGCSSTKIKKPEQQTATQQASDEIKEFTGLFAARNDTVLNENNEIRNAGVRCAYVRTG